MSRHGWTSKGRQSTAEKKKNGYYFRFYTDSTVRLIPTVDEVLDRITDETPREVASRDLEHNIGLVVCSVENSVRSLIQRRKPKVARITIARAIVNRCPKAAECFRNSAYVAAKAESGHPIMTKDNISLVAVARHAYERALYCSQAGCKRCLAYREEWLTKNRRQEEHP